MVLFIRTFLILFILPSVLLFFANWGLASAMCLNSNSCCFSTRCSSVIKQEHLINKLRQEIQELTKVKDCKSYKDILTGYESFTLHKRIHNSIYLSEFPLDNELPKEMTMFYTVTFSPQRFYNHTDEQYIDYILYHISELYIKDMLWYAYGCFEHHKSGVIHAHVVISSNQHDLIKKYLNHNFNHDARNRRCIDSSYVQSVEKVLNYINKVEKETNNNKGYFRLGKPKFNEYTPSEVIDPGFAVSTHKGYTCQFHDD